MKYFFFYEKYQLNISNLNFFKSIVKLMGSSESVSSSKTQMSNIPEKNPYEFIQKIYHPIFGDLILTQDTTRNKQMAVIEMIYSNQQEYKSYLPLSTMMQSLTHPHLLEINLLPIKESEVFSNCFKLHQMFEYHSLDLHSDFKLKRIKSEYFYSEMEVFEFLKQIVSALSFLQSKGVVHGGVNGYTIVKDQYQRVPCYKLLPPLGLKAFTNYNQVNNLGPLAKGIYLSPLQMRNMKQRDQPEILYNGYKADVFALGCIALGMIRHMESDSLFDYIKYEIETHALSIILNDLRENVKNPYLFNIMRWMLEIDEEKRCNFLELEQLIRLALSPNKAVDSTPWLNSSQAKESMRKPVSPKKPLVLKEIVEEKIEEDDEERGPREKKLEKENKEEQIVKENQNMGIQTMKENQENSQIKHLNCGPKENNIKSQMPQNSNINNENIPKGNPMTFSLKEGSLASSFINPQVLKILSDFNNNQNKSFNLSQSNKNFSNSENQENFPLQPSDRYDNNKGANFQNNFNEKMVNSVQIFNEKYPDGGSYEGEKIGNKKHGNGKYIYPDGSVYKGEWKNDYMDGFGTLYYPNQCLNYYGNWKEGHFHGKGSIYNNFPGQLKDFDGKDFNKIGNGWSKYEGVFVMNSKQGAGELFLMNGASFIGNFQGDMPHGMGIYRTEKGHELRGEWLFGAHQNGMGNLQNMEKEAETCWKLLSQTNF